MAPRILVTGFNAFPGAPVNPTEALIATLRADAPALALHGDVELAVLDVDYRGLTARLAEIGVRHAPDVAIHFGLSAAADGFVLERTGRNVVGRLQADNSGYIPPAACVVEGRSATVAGTLPYAAVAAALGRLALPWRYSDDAGDYLCNYLLYTACDGACPGFRPSMAGFVHVPPAGGPLSAADLVTGARAILAVCAAAWTPPDAQRNSGEGA